MHLPHICKCLAFLLTKESVNIYNLFFLFAVILRQVMLNLLKVQIVV